MQITVMVEERTYKPVQLEVDDKYKVLASSDAVERDDFDDLTDDIIKDIEHKLGIFFASQREEYRTYFVSAYDEDHNELFVW